ncbi:hypothetical protein PF008_g141 [Phytophthora fragariae]|uniref:Uncharacterized protein n=1 Tax=Phytophthora fragariae TaxID=53985 RepID=A0A6G0SQS6_9STRA|nr:hypothetical protein PF008_g141 [Phytophthora fragariae]
MFVISSTGCSITTFPRRAAVVVAAARPFLRITDTAWSLPDSLERRAILQQDVPDAVVAYETRLAPMEETELCQATGAVGGRA